MKKIGDFVIFESDDICALERYQDAYEKVVATELGKSLEEQSYEKHQAPLTIKLTNTLEGPAVYDDETHLLAINPAMVALTTFVGSDGKRYGVSPERLIAHELVHPIQSVTIEEEENLQKETLKYQQENQPTGEVLTDMQEAMGRAFTADDRNAAKQAFVELYNKYPHMRMGAGDVPYYKGHEEEADSIANAIVSELGEEVSKPHYISLQSAEMTAEAMLTAVGKPLPTPEDCKPGSDGHER